MLYRMRQTDGQHYRSGKWIAPDGKTELLASADITMTPLAFTENLRERLLLYRAYLYLIMVIEAAPRGYKGLTYALMHAFFRHNLRSVLRKLRAR